MKFHEYKTTWQQLKYSDKSWEEFANESELWAIMQTNAQIQGRKLDWATGRSCMFEEAHKKLHSPYYDVYPCIIPMLTKLDLSVVQCDSIKPPQNLNALVLRFPDVDHGLRVSGQLVRCIWIAFQGVRLSTETPDIGTGLVVGVDIGEMNEDKIMTVWSIRAFPLISGKTIQDVERRLKFCETSKYGIPINEDELSQCVKVALAICLISDDPEIVQPLPLVSDQNKYETADDDKRKKLINKAIRRGKHGFAVGSLLEVIPHFRRPHPALYHTGKNRTETRIVFRKGSIVHREKLTNVPTGNLKN